MSDRNGKSPLWQVREDLGYSREHVSRMLDPPISAKTIERWEKGTSPVPKYRLMELAVIYRVSVSQLVESA